MDDVELSSRIVNILAQHWHFHQTAGFAEYAKQTFGCSLFQLVKCDGMYIAEADRGDAACGNIGGSIKKWWFVDDLGITPIRCPRLPRFRDAPENLRSQFYLTPVIKFLRQGDAIAIGEAFGPDMHCRKVGKLVVADNHATICDTRLIWSSNTI